MSVPGLLPTLPHDPLYARWQLGEQLATCEPADWPLLAQAWGEQMALPISPAALRSYRRLYQAFPDPDQLLPELSWTHYHHLLRLPAPAARHFYLAASRDNGWSAATLARQIRTRYYERQRQADPLGLKPHYVFELDTLPADERALENALCDQLRQLLLELGPDFSYLGRQRCLRLTDGQRYFVDLLFYHLRLRTYLLVELKTTPLTHRDIGQLDTYTRLFDGRYGTTAFDSSSLGHSGEQSAPITHQVLESSCHDLMPQRALMSLGDQWRGRKPVCLGLLLCPSFNPDLLQYSALADRTELQVATYHILSPP